MNTLRMCTGQFKACLLLVMALSGLAVAEQAPVADLGEIAIDDAQANEEDLVRLIDDSPRNVPEASLEDLLDEFSEQVTAEKCINLRRLERSEILSNQSLIFHMSGDKKFINKLRYRCPGLRSNDTIMYETRSNRLCNLDSVTVLSDLGGRFMRGASCGLGSFYPVDDATVDLLKGNLQQRSNIRRGKGTIE